MPIINNHRISPKKMQVLLCMFKTRGGSIKQLIKGINQEVTKTNEINMYKTISQLYKEGLLASDSLRAVNLRGEFFYLSEEGYETVMELLDIREDKRGVGFNDDHGAFPYKFYRTPVGLKHHWLQVEMMLEVFAFKKEVDEHTFDYRDNRYASTRYKQIVKGEGIKPYEATYIFRPDGELKIKSNIHSIEYDRSTERGKYLEEKFEGYKRYFDYCTKNGLPLPASILFISEPKERAFGMQRRWHSLQRAFFKYLGDYATKVNLMYEQVDNVRYLFMREYYRGDWRESVFSKLSHYLKDPAYKGTPMGSIGEKQRFSHGALNITISNIPPKETLFFYCRSDGFETRAYAVWREFERYFVTTSRTSEYFKDVKQVVPVFYYFSKKPVILDYGQSPEHSTIYFEEPVFFEAKGEGGRWTTDSGLEYTENPLVALCNNRD